MTSHCLRWNNEVEMVPMGFCVKAYNTSMHFNDVFYKLKSVTRTFNGMLCVIRKPSSKI